MTGHHPSPGLRGPDLLHDPRYNKGTAFTEEERDRYRLHGLLPPRVFTMDEQLDRIRRNFDAKPNDLEKYIFLVALQDRNETLFYRFVMDHLSEMMPIIYTPTVGEACAKFGHIFRRPRGLYLSADDRGRIARVLDNWPEPDVRVIVVTDGERILGLGDLGAYGMGIPIGKLALYTACAGVSPQGCLPITLDVGTNREDLLGDPLYTGLRRERLRGDAYDSLLDEFVEAVQAAWPGVLLQFEDFATENAFRLLGRYRDRLCTFNDDIQGTAAVVLSALLASCRLSGTPLERQHLLFYGAGASATGVASLIVSAMQEAGLPRGEALNRCWFMDSHGLVTAERTDLAPHKRPFAHAHAPLSGLREAIEALQPNTLVGLSAQAGSFNQPVIQTLAGQQERPTVFALSNPTSRAECTAAQAYQWSGGRAIFASGSPFDAVELDGRRFEPRQANNAYIFPGLGLGVTLARARRVTDAMFHAAARVLADAVSAEDLRAGAVLPPLSHIRSISSRIAAAVVRVAVSDGLSDLELPEDLESWVEARMYVPRYEREGETGSKK